MNTPELSKGHRINFQTLRQAVNRGDAALVSCLDKANGDKPVALVCALAKDKMGMIAMTPLAILLPQDDENPFERFVPPVPGDETGGA